MGTPANTGRVDVANAIGQVRWQFKVDGLPGSAAIGPDGTVYFGIQAMGAGLYALDLESGAVKWSKPQLRSVVGAPALGSNGLLYVYTLDGLYALDARNGNQVWARDLGFNGTYTAGPAIGPDGTVYIGTERPSIAAYNGRTGATIWDCSTASRGFVVSCPATDGSGTVYAVQQDFIRHPNDSYYLDGSIVAVKAGRLLWRVRTGYPPSGQQSVTVGPNGLLYVIAGVNEFLALRPDTGAKVWSAPADWQSSGQVIGPDGTVYTSSINPSSLIAYNPANGQVLRSKPVGGRVHLHAMTNSTLYVVSEGVLTAYDAATLTANWTFSTGGFSPVLAPNSAVALAGDGTVVFPGSGESFGVPGNFVYAIR